MNKKHFEIHRPRFSVRKKYPPNETRPFSRGDFLKMVFIFWSGRKIRKKSNCAGKENRCGVGGERNLNNGSGNVFVQPAVDCWKKMLQNGDLEGV